jgi:hypothetical protein
MSLLLLAAALWPKAAVAAASIRITESSMPASIAQSAASRDSLIERGRRSFAEKRLARRLQIEGSLGVSIEAPTDTNEAKGTVDGSAKGRPGSFAKAATADWTPYTGPFTFVEAAHLLRRGMIGPRIGEMRQAAVAGLHPTVTGLLVPRTLPDPPGGWALEPAPDVTGWTRQMIDSLLTLYFTRDEMLKLWWAKETLRDDPGVTEEMTLFLHNHFATSVDKVVFPQSMYKQNQLLRQYAVGNFKTLVQQIAVDPAMLIWLDGNSNYVGNVNENFGRELLELFTLGLGQYTQDDVVAAARAFTGYFTFDGITTVFLPEYHDSGLKTFLGQTGNWDGNDIINIIFQQDEAARFFCRKLYRWFIDEYPDEALIEDLARTMRSNNYEIAPVLQRMFESQLFYDTNYRGAVICDGTDRGVGLLRSFYIDTVDYSDLSGPQAMWTDLAMYVQKQILLQPPNVGGWPGYRSWVNSYTLPWKRSLDVALVDGNLFGVDLLMKLDAVALARRLSDPNDPGRIVDDLTTGLYGMPPTPLVRSRLLQELLQGMDGSQWSIDAPYAEAHIQALMRLLIRMPDFQLK